MQVWHTVNVQLLNLWKAELNYLDSRKGNSPFYPFFVTFSTQLPDENNCMKKVKITWTQLPFQPSFSLTGHSAQGKTLPKIVTGMHKGGFSAYVAASRAQTWKGLSITHAVTLQDLNKPLPHTLITESQQLDAIEHNTLILHSFKPGSLKSIPDPESEYTVKPKLSVQSSTLHWIKKKPFVKILINPKNENWMMILHLILVFPIVNNNIHLQMT